MWVAYAIAVLPLIIGAVIWIFSKRFAWWEWAISTAVAFLAAVLFNAIVVSAMTSDTQTLSGSIVEAVYEPQWIEEYQVAIYRTVTHTDSKGRTYTTQVFSHYETRHRTHGPDWNAHASFGKYSQSYSIDEATYRRLVQSFGKEASRPGSRGGFDGGDRNDYYTVNVNRYVEPVTMLNGFENRVKACPSMFSFVKVPEGQEKELCQYPPNIDPFHSDRLMARARSTVDWKAFDQMNARLGPTTKVNVCLIDFGPEATDPLIARYQEAYWFGGKKNDLILCCGGLTAEGRPTWSYVFGWTEQEIVKRNLETILLTNKVDTALLPAIEDEIRANYVIKDWDKFNYLTVEPPPWSYLIFILVLGLLEGALWYYFVSNEYDKEAFEGGDSVLVQDPEHSSWVLCDPKLRQSRGRGRRPLSPPPIRRNNRD